MKKLSVLILFCSLFGAPIAMNGQELVSLHPGPIENFGLSIDAKLLTATPTIGKPILVEMTITHKNDKVYTWWIDRPEAEYRNFDFVLTDDQNAEVKRTAYHRSLRGEWDPSDGSNAPYIGNPGTVDLTPGQQVVLQVILSRLFLINHPGLYTLSISTKEKVSKTTKIAFSVAADK